VYAYFIADIAGHGVGAGLHSSVIKALYRENVSLLYEPAETFRRINSLMREYMDEGRHITAVSLIINRASRRATLLSAGHLPILVSRPDGSEETWSAEGDILGVFEVPVFKTATMKTAPGTRFWLFSDGVVEDFSRKRSWKVGLEQLRANLAMTKGLPLGEALEKACENLFTDGPGGDDRLLMVCEA
jgi:sigma-B regulation protein RsbU (phosphoserine phosphatase)